MIGHNAPSKQVVAVSIEMTKCVCHEFGDFWIAQPIRPKPFLESRFHRLVICFGETLPCVAGQRFISFG